MKQETMFGVADTPLFSGTALRVKEPVPAAPVVALQASFAGCRLCGDTGLVEGRRCWCGVPHSSTAPIEPKEDDGR